MIQGVMPLLGYFMDFYPVFFNDLSELYIEGNQWKLFQNTRVGSFQNLKSHNRN